jgi:hypothetical protein
MKIKVFITSAITLLLVVSFSANAEESCRKVFVEGVCPKVGSDTRACTVYTSDFVTSGEDFCIEGSSPQPSRCGSYEVKVGGNELTIEKSFIDAQLAACKNSVEYGSPCRFEYWTPLDKKYDCKNSGTYNGTNVVPATVQIQCSCVEGSLRYVSDGSGQCEIERCHTSDTEPCINVGVRNATKWVRTGQDKISGRFCR